MKSVSLVRFTNLMHFSVLEDMMSIATFISDSSTYFSSFVKMSLIVYGITPPAETSSVNTNCIKGKVLEPITDPSCNTSVIQSTVHAICHFFAHLLLSLINNPINTETVGLSPAPHYKSDYKEKHKFELIFIKVERLVIPVLLSQDAPALTTR